MIKRYLLQLDLQYFAQDPQALADDERSELIKLRKLAAITKAGITDPQDVANMQTHLEGLEAAADIQAKIDTILAELKLGKFQQGADPSPGNGFRHDPQPVSGEKIGRDLYHRIMKNRRR